jgi:integrase
MIDRCKYMSQSELARLREYALLHASPLEWLLIDVATQTGLRVSELAALERNHFNPDRRSLVVHRRKKRDGSPRPETIPLSPSLSSHIRDYLEHSPDFWVGQRGKATRRGLQQAWTSVIKRAGLSPKLSIHSARHTLAVCLLRSSKNLRLVQKQLGHSSPAVTANMYADIPFEDHQEEITKLFPEEKPKP